MVLYIVRHGEPDYAADRLLDSGWEQAKKAAARLRISGIDEIHSSPMGRAIQTAMPLAGLLSLPIIVEPWAYELGDESRTDYLTGKPHAISSVPHSELHAKKWLGLTIEEGLKKIEALQGASFKERYISISQGLDSMLAECGYPRAGSGCYTIKEPNDKHIALFCHAGMQRVMLSHLYHIPFQLLGSTLMNNFTGITVLYFDSDESKRETVPVLVSYGDVGHLYDEGKQLIHYSSAGFPF